MATANRENLTAEQQQARNEWVTSLSGRETKKYEDAQKIGKIVKPVTESHITHVLYCGKKYRAVV